MSAGTRVTAVGVAAVCFATAGYLALNARDAGTLRDANQLGLEGRYASAAQEAGRVSRPPADARAALVQAYALRALGRPADASAAFGRAARRDPNNWVIHRDWALVLAALGRGGPARHEMTRALSLNPRMSLPAGFPPVSGRSGSG